MGFSAGSIAKVWKFENKGNYSIVEISTSKKNEQTEQYETDFSSKFTRFIGKAHTDILKLSDGAKIKLGDIEVTNSYNKETNKSYTNFLVFSFEVLEQNNAAKTTNSDGFNNLADPGFN